MEGGWTDRAVGGRAGRTRRGPTWVRIAMYGLTLAVVAWLLRWMDFRYQMRRGPEELMLGLGALFFTGLGLWAGWRLRRARRPAEPFQENRRALDYLGISERELEILHLVAAGASNKEIARRAFISTNTVKTHLSSLYGKLDVSRRTQAVRKARELGILP